MSRVGNGYGNVSFVTWENDSFNIMYILSKAMNNIFNNYLTPEKDFQDVFGSISEVLITYITKRGKARPRVMLGIGTGHSNNC